ncbi:unnamed protein product [Diamesa tonsa]
MNTTTAASTTTNGLQNTTTVEPFTATPHVQILEQPAPKALRFRYECEGRSAGSIPGANSTVETKTYPEIQIVNYSGRAVVVVSCVTKDLPYRPHPHNLVGKEGCKKGVCTLEINNPEMKISFSNLGIQCVKKRDIDEALRVREEIRVDPFRSEIKIKLNMNNKLNGTKFLARFDHRNQPSSIDLNSVRLCFQVFLEGSQKGKFTTPLKPVVSEPIFDKKSMSDLVITKLSHCNAPIVGGQEMILLCEKVAKEDISVRFFEGSEDHPSWECNGEFQHSQVHKQVAIAFRTPRYHRIDLDHSVKVKVQLRRPSDGATSEALDFELLALDTGRRTFWNIQRELKKRSATTDLFQQLLEENEHDTTDNIIMERPVFQAPLNIQQTEVVILDTPIEEHRSIVEESSCNSTEDKTINWLDNAEFIMDNNNNNENDQNTINQNEDDKALNDLLEQVAELDVIYQDHQIRRDNQMIENELRNLECANLPNDQMDVDETFDDAATYTSLQRAFKQPIEMALCPPIPPRPGQMTNNTSFDLFLPPIVINPASSEFVTIKREETLPPLPPKRAKKLPDEVFNGDKENKNIENQEEAILVRQSSIRSLTPRPQSQIIIKSADQNSPSRKLPPRPIKAASSTNTLPKQKKSGFFSKMFSRKKSKSDLDSSIGDGDSKNCDISDDVENSSINHFSINDPNRVSIHSTRSLKPNQNTNKKTGVDLTEAEHYALYTSFAPHATQSEFDETSCYYSPVEAEHEFKRKRQRSSDDAALNAIKQSPGHHDGRKFMIFIIYYFGNYFTSETSPYNLPPVYAGNYRVPQTTPSPQPISPPNFYPVSPAPTSPYGNIGMGNILQNQLQAPRPNQHHQQQEQNQHLNINFQGSLQSPIFQQNQIPNHNIQNNAFAPESNQWNIPNNNINSNNNNLNLNVNAYNTNPNNRTLLSYNNIPHSSIFNTQSQAQNPINNLDGPSTSGTNNNNNESRTTLSNLLDMDTQNILNNLSGDLNSLSFSDFRSHDEPMSDSFIKLKSDLHNLGKCTTNDK